MNMKTFQKLSEQILNDNSDNKENQERNISIMAAHKQRIYVEPNAKKIFHEI